MRSPASAFSADEWYLAGHFPGRPIMPGVLIVEAMAQTGAVAVLSQEENRVGSHCSRGSTASASSGSSSPATSWS